MEKIGYGEFGFPLTNKLNDNFLEITNAVKYYTAFISQVGAAAPVETSVLKNTIGNPVWARTAAGVYTLTMAGAFVEGKTVPVEDSYTDQDGNLYQLNRTSANVMTLYTFAAIDTTTLADGVLNGRYINIEIYV
jgi:hypothetical protein